MLLGGVQPDACGLELGLGLLVGCGEGLGLRGGGQRVILLLQIRRRASAEAVSMSWKEVSSTCWALSRWERRMSIFRLRFWTCLAVARAVALASVSWARSSSILAVLVEPTRYQAVPLKRLRSSLMKRVEPSLSLGRLSRPSRVTAGVVVTLSSSATESTHS